MSKSKELLILILILVISALLRFYNLMFDAPYFFNPDEKNMAIAITRFRLPAKLKEIPGCLLSEFSPKNLQPTTYNLQPDSCNLNPHFFAYGQFPMYLAFASNQATKFMIKSIPSTLVFDNSQLSTLNSQLSTSLPSAIFWLRFWSALFSTLTVLLVYLITKKLLANKDELRITPALTRRGRNYELRGKKLSTLNSQLSTLAALSTAFTPGLIQAAHFGTTESLLTFFFLASIYLSFKLLTTKAPSSLPQYLILNTKYLILLSLTIGLALGSKLTGLFFFIPPFLALMIQTIKLRKEKISKGKKVICLFFYLLICLLIFLGSGLFFAISSPYNLIEFQNFKSAVFGYEADVATGRFPAFYTRQFVDTTPIVFQAKKIFPYALGWPIFMLGSLGFLLINVKLLLNIAKSIIARITNYELRITGSNVKFFIFNFSFLIYSLPHAFLFAKWTRFMTPVFPFFSIFAGYFLYQLFHQKTPLSGAIGGFNLMCVSGLSTKLNLPYRKQLVKLLESRGGAGNRTPGTRVERPVPHQVTPTTKFILAVAIFLSILPGVMFISIYTNEDSRVQASRWIYQNIPSESYILSETANVVDIPLGFPKEVEPPERFDLTKKNYQVISFDFYHMDENPLLFEELLTHLEKSDYIFIPSRRIFANYTRLSYDYPLLSKYYDLLFSGSLGFEKVTEFSSFPELRLPAGKAGITNYELRFDDERSEESFTVFDHPVVRIYRKAQQLTKDEYRMMLEE